MKLNFQYIHHNISSYKAIDFNILTTSTNITDSN